MFIVNLVSFKQKFLPIDLIGSKHKIEIFQQRLYLSTKIIPVTLIYTPQINWTTLKDDINVNLNTFITKNTGKDLRTVLDITIIEVVEKTYKDKQDAANKRLILTEENKNLLHDKIKVINTFKTNLIPQIKRFLL